MAAEVILGNAQSRVRATRWLSVKETAYQCRRCKSHGFDPWVRKISLRQKWQLTSVFLPGQRTLVGYSPGVTKSIWENKHTLTHTHTQNRMKGICEVWILDGEQFYKAEDIGTEHLRMVAGFMQNCRIIQWLGTVNILAANHAFEKGLPHRNNG